MNRSGHGNRARDMPQVCPKTGVPDSDEEAEPEAYRA
jgi:hypothetical protein